MYWLLSDDKQQEVRNSIDELVRTLSEIPIKPEHRHQVFPFQGRKNIYNAKAVIDILSNKYDSVCDPFNGSGTFAYAASIAERHVYANEYERYTYKMASMPFDLPSKDELGKAYNDLIKLFEPIANQYYRTKCECGEIIAFESLFFDRLPSRYIDISTHERLGRNGENVVFRGVNSCKKCKAKEKHFDSYDLKVLKEIEIKECKAFNYTFLENSRINLSSEYLDYWSLFPKRSKLLSIKLWDIIQSLETSSTVINFLEGVFLSILPMMKFKDYRSKSQDLHVPPKQLRETNILFAFRKQYEKRLKTLYSYGFSEVSKVQFYNMDYRDFLTELKPESMDLMITDPPWQDGCAYFERAQLYHPWIGYDLKKDKERLSNEVVVTDAPSRTDKRNSDQWWDDIDALFNNSYKVLKTHSYLVLYFRPLPAKQWIHNFNRIKLFARMNGFEPLLTIDVAKKDPSMRIQQSSHYAFSTDLIITFIKLADHERRIYIQDYDIDELAFRNSVELQDELAGTFTINQWKKSFFDKVTELNLHELNLPKNRKLVETVFNRIVELVTPGQYLPKPSTPYSDELFNIPYIERVSIYIPYVIEELLKKDDKFTFDQFLLKIAEFVENGTRSILKDILEDGDDSIHSLLAMYAEPIDSGKYFTKLPSPKIPHHINSILELDPYQFEDFVKLLLEHEGYTNVAVTKRSGDKGVDVRGNDTDGKLTIVQCKRYTKSNVDSVPIQRLHSYALTRGAKKMICITTTDFTKGGYDEARKTGVITIERNELEKLVHKHREKLFNQVTNIS